MMSIISSKLTSKDEAAKVPAFAPPLSCILSHPEICI